MHAGVNKYRLVLPLSIGTVVEVVLHAAHAMIGLGFEIAPASDSATSKLGYYSYSIAYARAMNLLMRRDSQEHKLSLFA